MNCPDIGTLRTALDQPASLRETPLAEHVADCADCRADLSELRRSAELAAPALSLLAPPETPTREGVGTALERERRHRAGHGEDAAADVLENGPGAPSPDRPRRGRPWSRAPAGLKAAAVAVVVAVTLGAMVATPPGRDAAAGLLAQFRSEELTVISFDPNDPGLRQGLAALHSVGTVDEDAFTSVRPERVDGLAEASRRVGFEVSGVPRADLPNGVQGEPTIYVRPGQEVSFTFDREKAREYVAQQGQPDVELPAKFDGASLVAEIPATAVLVYPGSDDAPRLVVGEAESLNVRTDGDVTLAEMREFLLDLPGLPEETVQQLRGISDWRTTLPVFVPAGEVDWDSTTVNGVEALSFSDRSGVVSALVWQRDGRIYGVGGPVSGSQARAVAETLAS